MSDVTKLPAPDNLSRVETGVVQFGDDWPGVFIRGDNAFFYAHALNDVLSLNYNDPITVAALDSLMSLLKSSGIGSALPEKEG